MAGGWEGITVTATRVCVCVWAMAERGRYRWVNVGYQESRCRWRYVIRS